jgi:hypothetical protein
LKASHSASTTTVAGSRTRLPIVLALAKNDLARQALFLGKISFRKGPTNAIRLESQNRLIDVSGHSCRGS